jgi:hemerythrin superfamily protein
MALTDIFKGEQRDTAEKATDLLRKDHDNVRALFREYEALEDGQLAEKQRLFDDIYRELEVHSQIEEEIFYPAFRDAAQARDDRELYFEAKEEHHVVDMVMPEVSEFDSEEEFAAKAKVLKDLIEHHADEEEKEMFPKARKLFDRAELRELGDRLKERKRELMR